LGATKPKGLNSQYQLMSPMSIRDHSLYWFGSCTSIESTGVKLPLPS